MDLFNVMLRVASMIFWTGAAIVGLLYRLGQFLFFFWRKHHRSPLVLPLSARFEHTHIVGGSGHGKTQLLQQLILYDLERGERRRGIAHRHRQPGRHARQDPFPGIGRANG